MELNQIWLDTPNIRVSCFYSIGDSPVVTVIDSSYSVLHSLFSGTPDQFIYWLFNSRCIMCKRPATEINEITPRSRSKDAIRDFRNRVTLCPDCHRKFHDGGVTEEKQKLMRMNREIFLIALGRKDYI